MTTKLATFVTAARLWRGVAIEAQAAIEIDEVRGANLEITRTQLLQQVALLKPLVLQVHRSLVTIDEEAIALPADIFSAKHKQTPQEGAVIATFILHVLPAMATLSETVNDQFGSDAQRGFSTELRLVQTAGKELIMLNEQLHTTSAQLQELGVQRDRVQREHEKLWSGSDAQVYPNREAEDRQIRQRLAAIETERDQLVVTVGRLTADFQHITHNTDILSFTISGLHELTSRYESAFTALTQLEELLHSRSKSVSSVTATINSVHKSIAQKTLF